jgi:dipeptidyl aminopeptidase/acylaminoacyl peptidase
MALNAPGMGQTSRKMPNYKKDFDTKSWIRAGAKVMIPTLIIHGTADEDVEVELGQELAKSIKISQIELFKGADHRFTKKEDFDKMVKDISDFIIKYFNERTKDTS